MNDVGLLILSFLGFLSGVCSFGYILNTSSQCAKKNELEKIKGELKELQSRLDNIAFSAYIK
jgi:hypothetical protein